MRTGFSRLCTVVVVASITALFAALPASARTRIGFVEPYRLESPRPIPATGWSQEIAVPGAGMLRVHLGDVSFGPGDRLNLYDGEGVLQLTLAGPIESGSWLPTVEGDRMVLEVEPAGGSNGPSLAIEELAVADTALLEGASPESICGQDDRKDPACYDQAKQKLSETVGRMAFAEDGGWYVCTGSLVSPQGHFISNNHCVSTQAGGDSLEVWWKYQVSGCGSGNLQKDSTSRGVTVLITDYDLDFTLMKFKSDNPSDRYGYLGFNQNPPVKGAVIWIPQHPGGNPKKFAVESDMDSGGIATIQRESLEGNKPNLDFGYYADTQGGSSGSPVLDVDGKIVGLHHFGISGGTCTINNMNQAVKMSLIYPLISPYLDCAPTCDASAPATGIAGVQVQFTGSADIGDCPGTASFLWNFGDGGTSAEQNPSYTYQAAGTFGWKLTVTVAGQQCVKEGSIAISSPCAPVCTASATPGSGVVPLQVSFSSSVDAPGCTGLPTYGWNFGDGGTSAEQNPSHTYGAAGTFNWSVAVSVGGVTCTKEGQVEVLPQCTMTCTALATPSSGTPPLTVSFTAAAITENCTGAPSFLWSFGDGAESSEQSPSHTYGSEGSYSWKVTVTLGELTCEKGGTIQVTAVLRIPGDCDGDGSVSIAELQRAINMFLGLAPPDCNVDCSGDGIVGIAELQKVINAFLGIPTFC